MRHGKVRSISSAPLRLEPRVLRQAEGLARSTGVSVSELVELLLQGLLEMEAGQVVPLLPPQQLPQSCVKSSTGARILVMDDFRRRAAASSRREGESGDHVPIRARAWHLRRRAAQLRARCAGACEAARRARETARVTLDELNRLAGRES